MDIYSVLIGSNISLINLAILENETATNRIWGDSGQVISFRPVNTPVDFNPGNLGVIFNSSDNMGTVTVRSTYDAMTVEAIPALNDKVEHRIGK